MVVDALAWCLVLGPDISNFLFQGPDPNASEMEDIATSIMGAIMPFQVVLLAHPQRYKQHVQAVVNSGKPSAFALMERYWVVVYHRLRSRNFESPIGEPGTPFEQLIQLMKDHINRFMTQIGNFTQLSDIRVEINRDRSKMERQISKDRLAAHFAITDACDHCGKSVDETKLMRCSRCLYARYCGRDCQAEAWKSGRNYGLKQKTELATLPHKVVCFDAKVEDVRVLLQRK